MSTDPQPQLQQIDTWIRQGSFQEAIVEIHRLEAFARQWKLQDILHFANICRRAGLPLISLKCLRPWIFLDSMVRSDAAKAAKVMYAAALFNIGANKEASSFFHGISEDQFPEILLHESFGLFREWRYKKSIPLLRRYIQHTSLTDYQRLVGKVNLIAALIFVGESTDKLMKESMQQAQKMNASLLYSNLLELQAQESIVKGQTDMAMQALQKASQFLSQGSSAYDLHLQKWTWFLRAQSGQESMQKLAQDRHEIQKKAVQLNHRETLRDMDLYWGHFAEDDSYIQKVWYGSPYTHYRDRIHKLTGKDLSGLQEHSYIWTPDSEDHHDQKVRMQLPLDLQDQGSSLTDQGLKILRLLSQDFYRPVRIGELFSQLYPDEHFDPHHSVDRLKKGLHRTRISLQELKLDLHLQWRKSEIQLTGTSSLKIKTLPLPSKKMQSQVPISEKWALPLEGKIFSRQDLQQASGYSESTFQRKIQMWLEEGSLIELRDKHQARKKYYTFASKDLRKIPGRFKTPKLNKKAS